MTHYPFRLLTPSGSHIDFETFDDLLRGIDPDAGEKVSLEEQRFSDEEMAALEEMGVV